MKEGDYIDLITLTIRGLLFIGGMSITTYIVYKIYQGIYHLLVMLIEKI